MKIVNRKNMMLIIGVLMAAAFVYTFHNPSNKTVSNYKLTDEITYNGQMNEGIFNGKGILKTPEGKYTGEFVDGRFSGNGKFKSKNMWTYKAVFHPKNSSDNVSITLGNKTKWVKNGDTWTEEQ